MSNQPDYEYLLKLEKWTKKDAALIICGFNPEVFRSIRFSQQNIPKKLEDAYKLYRLFCSVDFGRKYQDFCGYPFNYLVECDEKDIPINETLRVAAKKRLDYLRERNKRINSDQQQPDVNQENDNTEANNGNRERNYLLKIIGVLVNLYFIKDGSMRSNSKKVVSHLVEKSLQYLDDNELKSPGLAKSNLHKKITEGMRILADEQL